MLIAMQRPDATRVAGFRAWLKLNRCVRKGEKGIRIFAPMSVFAKDDTGAAVFDE
ncbi:MAG: ArdC family protein [Gaiellaceae bacterium]